MVRLAAICVRQPDDGHRPMNSTWPSAGLFVIQLIVADEEVAFVTEIDEMTGGLVSTNVVNAWFELMDRLPVVSFDLIR